MITKRTTVDKFTGPSTLLPKFLFGTVIDTNPAAFTVDAIIDGVGVLQGIPILNMHGSGFNRDVTISQNYRAAHVMIANFGADSYVIGTLPQRNEDGKDLNSDYSISMGEPGYGGGNKDTYQGGQDPNSTGVKGVLKNYQNGRPMDTIPGDKIIQTDNGTGLGLFREGIAKLKAAPLSQFLLFKYRGLARLVSRSFQFYSDFGEVEVKQTSGGKVGARIAGGGDFVSETHPATSAWTIQVWAGSFDPDIEGTENDVEPPSYTTHPVQNLTNADSRLYIRVNNAANSEFSTIMLDTNGNILMKMSGGEQTQVKKDSVHVTDGTSSKYTGEGTFDVVGENEEKIVAGDASLSVVGSMDVNALGSIVLNSSREVTIQTFGVVNIKAPKINLN